MAVDQLQERNAEDESKKGLYILDAVSASAFPWLTTRARWKMNVYA
jgi:hypothetical protein